MNDKIPLPSNKQEKVLFLYNLYKASTLPTDKAIFEEILRQVSGTSLRMLKQYKKDFGWSRENSMQPKQDKKKKTKYIHANGHKRTEGEITYPDPFPEKLTLPLIPESNEIKAIRSFEQLSNDEKSRLVKSVCDLYSHPCKSLLQACDEAGILFIIFTRWVYQNPIWHDIWNEAKRIHLFNHSLYCQAKTEENRVRKLEGYQSTEVIRFVNVLETFRGEEIRTTDKEMLRIKEYKANKWDLMEAMNASREYLQEAEAGAAPLQLDIKSMDDESLKQLLKDLSGEDTEN